MEDYQNPLSTRRPNPVRRRILKKFGRRRLEAFGFGECCIGFVGEGGHIPEVINQLDPYHKRVYSQLLTEPASQMPSRSLPAMQYG
jgi:hypothetical protein